MQWKQLEEVKRRKSLGNESSVGVESNEIDIGEYEAPQQGL